jgi:hypothetical protein
MCKASANYEKLTSWPFLFAHYRATRLENLTHNFYTAIPK